MATVKQCSPVVVVGDCPVVDHGRDVRVVVVVGSVVVAVRVSHNSQTLQIK